MAIVLTQCGNSVSACPPCGIESAYDQYKHYSYADSIPRGKYFDECPNRCTAIPNCSEGSCCGESIRGFIYSDPFEVPLFKNHVFATILGGSTIDDIGSVGGITFTPGQFPLESSLENDTKVIPEIFGNQLRLPFIAINGGACGPYGLSSVGIHWSIN